MLTIDNADNTRHNINNDDKMANMTTTKLPITKRTMMTVTTMTKSNMTMTRMTMNHKNHKVYDEENHERDKN